MISFYLGGARSGKSSLAELEVSQTRLPVLYIATSRPSASMQERIRLHKQQRPDSWQTLEVPVDLVTSLIKHDKPEQTIIIDCLTLWLTNQLLAQHCLKQAIEELAKTLANMQSHCVLVSTECGQSLIPEDKMSQLFVNASGEMHQIIAEIADKVTFCQSKIANTLKMPKELSYE
ncbi:MULTISPECIES: bifunctional adenosylcobinamide kinase/adenosylcobinamide-phosphate guanylyltransferase [unclassified Shewanella]|uniref:bifunctional adenosylcobinamide kinase/adenosylcobinamide-phosphate guanylyltransferase n=1 Tax=unclassified Shewanella TaxID=196818 RepID=UPI000C84B8CE|nr:MULTISPECIES: bifunctional adenosylcobinamide kinase/adenosylcobinamide-phosphate guanylyltransferase [unclassified Shewanella]MDO6620527.1 bifunctional adenosylcobinamide kinase/adenosylcobinamide-phosphate guanylyltransferase [Shewanella sp. 6_MG-2023]MDO6777212.1 bifunctional adenosylcobinamide kinase/adenosylcobinamide-phosphate guanylyltransferase [Shewanella sp. 3_MG-2023]PMG30930.1 cobinamide kinase [Shewanella sp. 10N.286.52.C2]PMG51926.1 cobinamide kinase [Shewanella sp. 10N.286.52.